MAADYDRYPGEDNRYTGFERPRGSYGIFDSWTRKEIETNLSRSGQARRLVELNGDYTEMGRNARRARDS